MCGRRGGEKGGTDTDKDRHRQRQTHTHTHTHTWKEKIHCDKRKMLLKRNVEQNMRSTTENHFSPHHCVWYYIIWFSFLVFHFFSSFSFSFIGLVLVDCRQIKKALAAKHKNIAARLFEVLESKTKEYADGVMDEFR